MKFRVLGRLTAILGAVLVGVAAAPTPYHPAPVYCADGRDALCPLIPGDIGPDPALNVGTAYNGIVGSLPASAARDPQTPFDNLSWQTFIALNWRLDQPGPDPAQGLSGQGRRVWQGWRKVEDYFGNGPVRARCAVPTGMEVFAIASNGKGDPVGQNEEYIQAATGDPLIDVAGNWTIYERRLNDVEIAYLDAPQGHPEWTLRTLAGQKAFVAAGQKVSFPAMALGGAPNGAMEIKTAWRVLDPARHAENVKRFFVVRAMLTVPPDLVAQAGTSPAPICDEVDLGLVAMHIMQKNPLTTNALKPEWFWSTFEHVDNAPDAAQPCDPTSPATCPILNQLDCPASVDPTVEYSYFNKVCPGCATNQPPVAAKKGTQFQWSPRQPYAAAYMTPHIVEPARWMLGTQVSRCWSVYPLTESLNTDWRGRLRAIGSVFQNYKLVGTQWGGALSDTPNPNVPSGVVPAFLSNSVVETYLQTKVTPGSKDQDAFNTGSCITCHRVATFSGSQARTDLSFLPSLAQPGLIRRKPITAKP